MSKAARLQRIHRNLAKKSNNFEDQDKQYAFLIWLVEKEFNIMIHEEFPLMKFWNYYDEYNLKKHESLTKGESGNKNEVQTFK